MVILFFALSEQISQFTSEDEYFPYTYQSMLIEKTWVENNIVDKITETLLYDVRYDHTPEADDMHPACRAIQLCFDEMKRNKILMEKFDLLERLNTQYDNYGYGKNQEIERELQFEKIIALERQIHDNTLVKKAANLIFQSQKADYKDDIIRFNKIFALKRTAFDFIFILPFLLLLVLWNRRALQKENNLSVVISSHLILVALVPLMFEFIRLIIEIIPRVILKTIYDFLIKLNLISFWYYAVLFISIAIIAFIVWLLQTKVFTTKRMQKRRFEKKQCMHCSAAADYQKEFCPVCGGRVLVTCTGCGKLTVNNMDFCNSCGKPVRD